jgi:hypothetical protein
VIRPLRRVHLMTMVLLALVLPAILAMAVVLREPRPPVATRSAR